MTSFFTSRTLFALAATLIVAANTVVLLGIAANRSGEPEARPMFSERELRLPFSSDLENSGLALQLIWRTLDTDRDNIHNSNWTPPAWLTSAKMAELGFTMPPPPKAPSAKRPWRRPQSREVFVALELDGESYREALRRAEVAAERNRAAILARNEGKRTQELLEAEKRQTEYQKATESRLFAVDAGNDAAVLRARYPDRSKFLILRGAITPQFRQEQGRDELTGTISRLSVDNIHIPRQYRPAFDALTAEQQAGTQKSPTPRYTVEVAFGSRFEPWILAVNGKEVAP